MRTVLIALAASAILACGDETLSPLDPSGSGGSPGATSGAGAAGAGGEGAGGEGGAPPAGATALPGYFRMNAVAQGSNRDGLTATCSLDFIFDLQKASKRTDELVEYPGVQGGEAVRTILDSQGDGFSFHADTYAEITARLRFPDVLEIEIPINETADGRFWTEMARFEGTVDADGFGAGAWRCAPLDIDQGGYLDETLSVSGTWEIEPEPEGD
jgi:hypothetical protein